MDRKNNQHTQRQQPTTMPILRYVIGIGMLVILLFWTENVAQASTTHADTLMIPLEQPTTTSTSRIHYVESNGDCGGVAPCYDTIQASVNASIAGDTIKIAQGTYTTLGLTVVYVTKGITLTGGYTNTNWDVAYPVTQTAVIDAENAPRRRGIYIDASNVSTVTLTGLTIQRGNANDRGAGIYSNYSHVVLRNNQILSNTTAYGGGIYAIRGSLSLYENLFLNNSGSYGGGIYANSSSTTMHHNTFQNNSGNDGAGIYLIHGIATLIDNIFEGNTGRTGGGIYLDGKSSSFLLKDNLFENNSASYGGAMSSAENGMTLINNTFRNNSASQLGGGMYLYKSHPTLYKNYYLNNSAQSGGGIHGFIIGEMTMIKNVIMDNRAEQYGGGIVISGSTGSIVRAENDIIANNSAINEGIYVASGSVIASHWTLINNGIYALTTNDTGTAMLTNTIVVSHTYAGFGGTNIIADHTLFHNIGSTPCDSGAICTNNISGDPKFIDPTNGDYRLGSGSAAIDAGIDAGVADDIAGVARPVGSAPDIGAYEYTFCNDVTEIPELECEALVGLYNSTAGLQWLDAKDWLTSNTPCSWGYVTCAAGHVTELVMPNNGLRGDMPAALGNLSQLTHLDLSGNQLSGNVPATLGNLSNLQTLTLQGNPLTGSLPESLQDVRLQDFHFQATNLCTPISSAFELWLADIPNLTSTETPCLLHLTKDVSVDTAAPNETVTYKIAISATSQTTVQVTDTLPAGITNITNLSPEAIYDSEAHQIRYTGDVSPETPVALTYAGTTASTLGAGSILYNEAVATAMGTTVEDSATIVVPIGEHTSKTLLLIYGGGDNELHDDLYDLLNRAELAANNPNVAIMMLLDGAGADDTVVFQIAPDTNLHCPNQHNPTCGGRYTYGKNLWSWTDNTASPYSLSEFIQTGMRIYPDVDQVMLSLVGHGAGWAPNKRFAQPPIVDIQPNYLGGLLIDHHPYRSLSTAALGNALKWVYEETGRKIDLVYFDACSMGMWEVAYEVSPYVHYQMFSANTAWAAFPYDQHINAIDGKKDVAEIGQAWIQNEISALNGDYPFTFSLVESSKLSVIQDALTEVSDGLIQTLDADGDTTRGKLRTVFDDTERFESNYDGYINEYDNYSDLSSFATELVKQFPSLDNQAKTLQTAISEAVIFQKHGSGRPWVYFSEPPYPDKSFWQWNQIGGIGIYMPFNQDHDEWKRQFYTDAHIKTAETGRWDELIAAFWDGLDAAQQRTSRTETQETQPPICPPDCDGMGAPLSLMPTLLMPVEAQTTYSQSINIPIDLELYGNTLTEGKFIVEFDNTCLAVDPAKIEFVDATGTATLENANQLVLTGIQSSGSSTLHQGQLVNMPVTAICEPDARTSITISVTITSVTFTDNQAATIPGTAVDGVITIRSTAIEGDINGDEAVNIFDLQILINMITNDVPADPDLYPLEQWERAELNGDGGWNIFDLQLLINLITQ